MPEKDCIIYESLGIINRKNLKSRVESTFGNIDF